MKTKIKPIDLWEIQNIQNSDTFVVYDCPTETREEFCTLAEVKPVVNDTKGRKLVYAYNKINEEEKGGSRQILVTPRLLKMYEEFVNV